jgi:hypothetical protein
LFEWANATEHNEIFSMESVEEAQSKSVLEVTNQQESLLDLREKKHSTMTSQSLPHQNGFQKSVMGILIRPL